jgi:cyanobactin biosynthesis protein (PatB/AcyB/McaB family)
MKLPKQSPPVKRPHFIQIHECVDVIHGDGEDLLSIRMKLMHGANYNDPAQFQYPAYGYLKMSSFGRGVAFR